MSKYKPKTIGVDWLSLSLASFNGSGRANLNSPQAYLDSYRLYKLESNKLEAVQILDDNYEIALEVAARFAHKAPAPGPAITTFSCPVCHTELEVRSS